MKVTDHLEEEDVEGECEGDDEDREDEQHLQQCLQDLHEHHDVDAAEVEPAVKVKVRSEGQVSRLNEWHACLCRNMRRLNQARKTAMAAHCHCSALFVAARNGATNTADVM